jgi:hypothetical protein
MGKCFFIFKPTSSNQKTGHAQKQNHFLDPIDNC